MLVSNDTNELIPAFHTGSLDCPRVPSLRWNNRLRCRFWLEPVSVFGSLSMTVPIPWFGVQIGVLQGNSPLLAAIYLPVTDTLYFAEKGRGVFRNRRCVRMTTEKKLENVLCSFGMDATGDAEENLTNARLLARVAGAVRNIRVTNSLMDFCYAIDGRLGGCINLNTKLWDILPASLMLREAGGKMTDLDGRELSFELGEHNFGRNYAILAASTALHRKLTALTRIGSTR